MFPNGRLDIGGAGKWPILVFGYYIFQIILGFSPIKISWKMTFSNYFLSFLNPKKLFWFEISLFFWSVAPGKIGNFFCKLEKKILLGIMFFLAGNGILLP